MQNGPDSMWLTSRTVIPASGLVVRSVSLEAAFDMCALSVFNEIILYGVNLAGLGEVRCKLLGEGFVEEGQHDFVEVSRLFQMCGVPGAGYYCEPPVSEFVRHVSRNHGEFAVIFACDT